MPEDSGDATQADATSSQQATQADAAGGGTTQQATQADASAEITGERTQADAVPDDEQPITRRAASELRRENQSLRSRATTAETRITELEASHASEVRALRTQLTVVDQARALGFTNPRIAHRLIDPASVEYDADGQPTNTQTLLEGLLASDPYLAQQSASWGAGATGRPTSDGTTMDDMIRRAAGIT